MAGTCAQPRHHAAAGYWDHRPQLCPALHPAPAHKSRLNPTAVMCCSRQPTLPPLSPSFSRLHNLQGGLAAQHGRAPRSGTVMYAKPGKAPVSSSKGPAKQPQDVQEEEEEDLEELEDGFYEDEDEFEYEDLDEFADEFDEGDDLDDSVLLGLEADNAEPGVDTGGNSWAEEALRSTQTVLSRPGMSNLELYVFRALPGGKLDIRLDRLDDTYGSPSIDDIEKFSRMLNLELESRLGTAVADGIALEVSSPGAERTLRLPKDLERFTSLPLSVEYEDSEGKQASAVLVLDRLEGDTSIWRLADVRANAPTKGRKMSAKQKKMQISIPVAKLLKAKVHVDF